MHSNGSQRRSSGVLAPALLALSALLAGACGGDPGARNEGDGGVGEGGSSGAATTNTSATTTSSGGSQGTGAAPEDPGVPEAPEECAESVPGQPLLRRLTQRELLNSEATVFGALAAQASTALPADLQSSLRMTNDAATLVMGSQMAEAVLARAEEVAALVTTEPTLSSNLACASQADATCAGEFIDHYGSALFRRPLSDAERTRYLALHASIAERSDFATGLKWALVALIQSPHAVYRSEIGEGGALTAYEVASELAYDYSARPPSALLVELALSGALADPAARIAQAKALLESPGGREVVQQFFSEWLQYAAAGSANRANAPSNFETIRSKMVLETQRFLEEALYARQGTLSELLRADYTIADADLSAYYGFTGGDGDLFAEGGVALTRSHGVGIFAQGSVLTTMASAAITSPTRRGLLLLKRLFCEVPGAPKAVNFDLTRSDVQGNTTRERLENSHLAEGCKGCHAGFDPLGFAFENFDHIGRYRTEEVTANGSFPIDASVTIERLGGELVNGQEELMGLLAEAPEVLSCVSATLERYVYGSDGTCRAKVARGRVMEGGVSVVDFLADLAGEPHFVTRE